MKHSQSSWDFSEWEEGKGMSIIMDIVHISQGSTETVSKFCGIFIDTKVK